MNREELNIVVVGHVDHGKSTLIGRLLYDSNALPQGAIDKVKKISEEKGKNFEYAYLLDAFEEEQKQGITIDITRLRFQTPKRDYIIIDAPGHKEFLKNMISGAASAEAAFLLIDANEGIQEQSKRHCYILSLIGIKKVYVIVNKMDLVDYSEDRYLKIQEDFNTFLNNLNIYPQGYIPISAYYGENVTKESSNMPWYKGGSILENMDTIEKELSFIDKELRFPIQDVYKFDSRRIVAGRIESGSLRVGEEISIYPSGKKTRVKTIENWSGEALTEVYTGQSVGITLEDEFFNKRGEVITSKKSSVSTSNLFNASIFWLGKAPLEKNKKYKLKLTTESVECEIFSINKVMDASTLKVINEGEYVNKNDVAEVTIKTKEPIVFDEFNQIAPMGRFVIVDNYDISGGGIVNETENSLKRNIEDIKSKDISIRKRLVTRKDREEALKQKGKVIWITGLPGCGKNEIAIKLEKKLHELGKKVYYLNSSNLRFGLSKDLDFTRESVQEHSRRIAEVANILVDSGIITIVTSVSSFREDRKKAREIIGKGDYFEIFVDTPIEICKIRNPRSFKEDSNSLIDYEKADYIVNSIFIDNEDFNSDNIVEEILGPILEVSEE